MSKINKTIILGTGLLFVILFVGFAWPRSLALYYYVNTGRIVGELWTDSTSPPCTQPLSGDPDTQALLIKAKHSIEQSIRLTPETPRALLMYARILCFSGEFSSALEIYKQYLGIRTANPLAQLEAGLADLQICCPDDQNKPAPCSQAAIHLTQAGVDAEDFRLAGFESYNFADYGLAFQKIHWFTCLGGESDQKTSLIHDISSVVIGNPDFSPSGPLDVYTVASDQGVVIQGEDLTWFRSGASLGEKVDKTVANEAIVAGIWSGGSVGALVVIDQPGNYIISVKAVQSNPSPVNFQIEHNFVPIDTFQLEAGDGSFQLVSTMVDMPAGYQFVGVNFLNDEMVDGIDRNLYVDFIIIHEQ